MHTVYPPLSMVRERRIYRQTDRQTQKVAKRDRDNLTIKISLWRKESINKNYQLERLLGNSFSDTFVLCNIQRK